MTHTHEPDRGATRNLVEVWQGFNCPRAEVGTAGLLIKDIVRDLSRSHETYQEVMTQHHETVQFLTLFQKKLIIHKGEDNANSILCADRTAHNDYATQRAQDAPASYCLPNLHIACTGSASRYLATSPYRKPNLIF